VAVALTVAVAVILAIAGLIHRFKSPARNSIIEAAAAATPDAAALLLEANDVANRVVERFPESPRALAVMAQAHALFGGTDDAIQLWEQCIRLDPQDSEACFQVGSLAQGAGDQAKAAEYFQKAARLDPGSSIIPVEAARALMDLGKLEEAAAVLEKDLQVHPSSMPSFALLGQVCVQLKQYEKARSCLETAVQMGPEYTNAYYGLATACGRLGDREKSAQYAEKFKALKARDEQAHRDLLKARDNRATLARGLAQVCAAAAKVYIEYGEIPAAEEHLLRGIRHDPAGVECPQIQAWLYERLGRVEEAAAVLEKLGETNPDDPSVCVRIGSFCSRRGRFEEAEKAFVNAVRLTPHQAGGYALLARLYLEANWKLPDAKTMAEKAVRLEPLAENYYLLSSAALRNGEPAEALRAIERAVALAPGNAEYVRAHELIRQGRPGAN
jgi:tetratricopeptide (TPR) repeat protein